MDARSDAFSDDLDELKALLGDEYQTLDQDGYQSLGDDGYRTPVEDTQQQLVVPVSAAKCSPKKSRKKRKRNEEGEETPACDAEEEPQQSQAPFLERIRIARQENEALAACLRAALVQVERQLRESDNAASTIKQAQAVDRNLGRQAGGAQQFSWTVRHSEATRGCSRLLAATGAPAPPQSTFWARSGKSPAPSEGSKALTKLFWRNPAAAKPPRAWTEADEDALLATVRSVTTTQQRAELIRDFRAQVATGADAAALKLQLARQLEALGCPSGAEEGAGRDSHSSSSAALHGAASRFTLMEWQSVAQQVGDRRADECAAHFFSHAHPRLCGEGHRSLSPDEQRSLLHAVAAFGRRSWTRVAAECRLPAWQPWCLLQAFWQAATAADAAQEARTHACEAPALQGAARITVNGDVAAANHEQQENGAAAAGGAEEGGAQQRYWQWPQGLDEKLLKVMADASGSPWGAGAQVSWMHVAFVVRGGVTAEQCKRRFWCLQHAQRQVGAFTAEESQALHAAVRDFGQDWCKVARGVPGRTARQCGEHHMFSVSRPARDVAHLWTPGLRRHLFKLRVQHSRGARQVQWPAVASALSERCGLRLSVEDVRKKSRALVKRLASHGMPPGYSIVQQLDYLEHYPDALDVRADRFQAELHAWCAENGINVRASTAPAPPPPPVDLGAAAPGVVVAGRSAAGAAVPPPESRSSRLTELLKQTQYLCFVDEIVAAEHAEGDGEPPEPSISDLEGSGAPQQQQQQDSTCHPRQGRAAEVLKGASSTTHPVAAALRAFLLAKGSRDMHAPAAGVSISAAGAEAGQPPQASGEPRARDPAAAPQARGGVPQACGENQCGGAGGAGPDVGVQTRGDGTAGQVLHAGLLGSGDVGMMGEGRWLQDVKVNPARRRARIASLQRAKRLVVCARMPQWREEYQVMQGRVGLSGVAQCARHGGGGVHVPRETQNVRKGCSLGDEAADAAGDPSIASLTNHTNTKGRRKRKMRVARPEQVCVRDVTGESARRGDTDATDAENRAVEPEATGKSATRSAAAESAAAAAAGASVRGARHSVDIDIERCSERGASPAGASSIGETATHGGTRVHSAGAAKVHADGEVAAASQGRGTRRPNGEVVVKEQSDVNAVPLQSSEASSHVALAGSLFQGARVFGMEENENGNTKPSGAQQEVLGAEREGDVAAAPREGARKRPCTGGSTRKRVDWSKIQLGAGKYSL